MQKKRSKYEDKCRLFLQYISTRDVSFEPVVTGLTHSSSVVTSGSPRREYCQKQPKALFNIALSKIAVWSFSIFHTPLFILFFLLTGGVISILSSNILFTEECSAVTSASLTISTGGVNQDISKPINDSSTVMPGNVAYSKEYIVNVNASDIESYTLKISGNTNLTGPIGSTTIGGANNKTPANMTNNTWGYGWGDTTTNKDSLYYQTLTTTNGGTGISVGNVSNNAINSSKKLVFAAKFADTNTNAGHYTANVNLSLVATPAATVYTLTYDANNGTNAPTAQTCSTYSTSCNITMSYTNPTRTGYTFQGWGDSSTGSTNSNYGSGKTITMTANKTIYAIWKENAKTITESTNMTDLTSEGCAKSTQLETKQLIDTRINNDGQTRTYWVTKLPDGNCWMTQNLDYDGGGTRVTDYKTSWQNIATVAQYYDPGLRIGPYAEEAATGSTDKHLLVGNYYSWAAANAGVCPSGWQLPISDADGANGSIQKLRSFITSGSRPTISPYYFQLGMYFRSGGMADSGTMYGYYWTSTPAASDTADVFQIADYSTFKNTTLRYDGYSVRCLVLGS